MGLWLSRMYDLLSSFSADDPARILMLGLDAAGKTTFLYKLKLNETITTIPTIGFNVETVTPCKGLSFTVWDIGGQDKLRPLWSRYFDGTHGLIYIVDSSDRSRFTEAREELYSVLKDDRMRTVPVVIVANKQDMPEAASPSEVLEKLNLRQLGSRKWHVQGTCAVNGEGVYEAMDALSGLVKEYKKSIR